MIDLNKIESRLDAALEAETEESLNTWLKEKRNNTIPYLGEGELIDIELDVFIASGECVRETKVKFNVENANAIFINDLIKKYNLAA